MINLMLKAANRTLFSARVLYCTPYSFLYSIFMICTQCTFFYQLRFLRPFSSQFSIILGSLEHIFPKKPYHFSEICMSRCSINKINCVHSNDENKHNLIVFFDTSVVLVYFKALDVSGVSSATYRVR